MKKLIVFILTFAYLTSISGATVIVQQCMGKTTTLSFCGKISDKCNQCGMQKSATNQCCKGHVKVLKVHNDQNIPETFSNKISLPVTFFTEAYFNPQQFYFVKPLKNIQEHRSPPNNNFCILYCTFLI